MVNLRQTIIRFPEIMLETRDAHKLRGYFGNLFKEHSSLLHNHLETGDTAYRYPLVQYKVLNNIPTLIGLNEGADLLIELFLKIKELKIGDKNYPVMQKNIENKEIGIGLSNDLHNYHFQTLWMALSQQNYAKYRMKPAAEQQSILKAILIGNMLSLFKSMNYRAEQPIMASLKIIAERQTNFKNNSMLAFEASFVANVFLPEFIGLGKSVARGFGTVGFAV